MNINQFRQTVVGLARGTTFRVVCSGAAHGRLTNKDLTFTCKAANLPASTIGSIPVSFFGRKVNYPGDRTYADWTVTIIGTNTWKTYQELYNWQQAMNRSVGNYATSNNANNFKANANVIVYDQTDKITMQFTLVGLFPTNLADVSLDWGNTDQEVDFTVTFAFDWAVMGNSSTADNELGKGATISA